MTQLVPPEIPERDVLYVKGAEEHNLKHVTVTLPKKKLVVFTGVSGSGKSSLAFDTIFAEGQRRYVESLSSYARQFLGQMDKPKYESIRGLAPTISIEQKSASKNPRSTVGTITEVYDYLRVLYARIGTQFCYKCGKKVGRGDAASMVQQILELPPESKILILAPLIEHRKGTHKELIEAVQSEGFERVRVNGSVVRLSDVQDLAKHKKHTIELVIDRLLIKAGSTFRQRLTDSVEQALKRGHGSLIVHHEGGRELRMSEERSCCGIAYPELDPPLFSFNSPLGMCPTCNGLGTVVAMDPDKVVPDKSLSIRQGAVLPWANYFKNGDKDKEGTWSKERFNAMEKQLGINFDKPWDKLGKKVQNLILYGEGKANKALTVKFQGAKSQGTWQFEFEGVLNAMMRRYLATQSEAMKDWYARYMSSQACEVCSGQKLKPEVLAVRIAGKSIMELCRLPIEDSRRFLDEIKLSAAEKAIAQELMKEIQSRLSFLVNVGLSYLTLDRRGPTLSGGEAQRIRLASQIGSELTGVLYILDEPSIGLHQRDNQKLLRTLQHLRDLGNSLIVVEHDEETIEAADWIVDFGPGAGIEGGTIVAEGVYRDLCQNPQSLTGRYLSGEKQIPMPATRRTVSAEKIVIEGASANNLQGIDVEIPLKVLTAVTGVSGAGKSTLINQILYPAIARRLHDADVEVGQHKRIRGLEHIDKIINIDQKPIGRTPRSNPATYTKVFDLIRDFYALLPESQLRGYSKGRFSFNVKGGRCEPCQGDGFIKVEMHFLADVFVPCEACKGLRFNESTREILHRGKSIADVLGLSVREAREHFQNHPRIVAILDTLMEVGLSYVKLGQSATTLSGGEAQRIKLARELAKRDTGRTLYILDEPTTGLHFHDIAQLLQVLQRLVDAGNSVVVIEHNLDVIRAADWVIDIGPEGGKAGGALVGAGTPEALAAMAESHTGRFLKEALKKAQGGAASLFKVEEAAPNKEARQAKLALTSRS